MNIQGTIASEQITGTSDDDLINSNQGGQDTMQAGDGDDASKLV